MDDDSDYEFIIKTTTSSDNEDEDFSVPVLPELQNIKSERHSDGEDSEVEVKEEIEVFENDLSSEVKVEHGNNEKAEFNKLLAKPIVFTTKLDDMRIMSRNIGRMTTVQVINSILKESTPKYNNQKPTKKCYSKSSYRALVKKISDINKKNYVNYSETKTDSKNRTEIAEEELQKALNTSIRNKKLLNMCKPVSIVLERIDHQPRQNKTIIQKETLSNSCLVFQDLFTQETDIYCIKNDALSEHHTLKHVREEAISPCITAYQRAGIKTRKLYFCCWYQRDAFIDSIDYKKCNSQIKQYMKKPHLCAFDRCTCCCRPLNEKGEINESELPKSKQNILRAILTSDKTTPEDVEIKYLEKEISDTLHEIKMDQGNVEYGYKSDWLEDLLEKAKKHDSFVSKAIKYTRPALKSVDAVECKQCKNTKKSLMRFDSKDKKEFYELQGDEVVAYIKEWNKAQSIYQHTMLRRNNIACIVFNDTAFKCCWYSREKRIKSIQSKFQKFPRFIKLPHACLPGNCSCCCKPKETTSSPLINIVLPSVVMPPKENLKTALIKFVNKVPSVQHKKQNTVHSDVSSQPKQAAIKPPTSILKPQLQINSKPIRILPKPSTSQLPFEKAIPSTTIRPNQLPSKAKRNVEPQKDTTANTTTVSDRDQELAVGSMITTILDRFKDVRLSINEDGKVAASLNAPVDTLTTAELKVLANILAHAQKQVKALGLNPGSQINAKVVQESKGPGSTGVTVQPVVQGQPKSTMTDPSQNHNCPPNQSNVISNIENVQSNTITVHKKTFHNAPPKPEILRNFSNISQSNSNSLMQSYTAYIGSMQHEQQDTNSNDSFEPIIPNTNDTAELLIPNTNDPRETFIPKIANVFSLKDVKNDSLVSETEKISARKVWSENAAPLKRKSVDSQPQPKSKIRVVDPAKLGITGFRTIENSINKPAAQIKVLNNNLTDTQTTIIPVSVGTEVSSFPAINTVLGKTQTTSAITGNQNNVIYLNALNSIGPITGGNVLIPSNSNNIQVVTPVNINAIAQNIQMVPHSASGTVFTISNLDKGSIAQPRLLNAEPAMRPRSFAVAPPPLIRVTSVASPKEEIYKIE